MFRLGLQIPNFTFPDVPDERLFDWVAEMAVAAEESGFDSVWVMDHLYQIPGLGPQSNAMIEAYSLLAGLAVRTSRAHLGALVTPVTYRWPALLAKQVTALDLLSGGRAVLGIGAGWFEPENLAYGIPFPSTVERLDRLEEGLHVIRTMFTEERATVEGRYYSVTEAMNYPRPRRPGGIPILVGGGGEKRTLRMVARHADACNLFGPPELIRQKLDVLARHCEAEGRDPAEIAKTRLSSLAIGRDRADARRSIEDYARERGIDPDQAGTLFLMGGPDELAEEVGALLDAGLDGLIFNMPHVSDPDEVRRAGELLRPLLPA
jgi:F420-dependent oxidoreductase-like protein